MASKNKKSKHKGKQKKQPALSQQTGREHYFLSDRLKNLPQGQYYSSRIRSVDDDISVMITREHTNGHISYVQFCIQGDSGLITNCNYDFNLSIEKFDFLISELGLEPTSDKEAMELIVYEAEELHQQVNEKTPANFWIVKNILAYDFETLKKGNTNRMLRYQSQLTQEDLSSIANDAKPSDQNLVPTYTPTLMKGWSEQRWDEFIQQSQVMDHDTSIQADNLSPWLFIFEKLRVATAVASTTLLEKIDLWIKSNPSFREVGFVKETPLSNHQEQIDQHALLFEKEQAIDRKRQLLLVKKMEKFQLKYPKNTRIPLILHRLYLILGSKQKAYKLISGFYVQHPQHQSGLIAYFSTIYLQQKPLLINKFLAKGILIEDHIKEPITITEELYLKYYYLIASTLLQKNSLVESWTMFQHFAGLPSAANSDQWLDYCQIYYSIAGTTTQEWLRKQQSDNLPLYKKQLEQLAVESNLQD